MADEDEIAINNLQQCCGKLLVALCVIAVGVSVFVFIGPYAAGTAPSDYLWASQPSAACDCCVTDCNWNCTTPDFWLWHVGSDGTTQKGVGQTVANKPVKLLDSAGRASASITGTNSIWDSKQSNHL